MHIAFRCIRMNDNEHVSFKVLQRRLRILLYARRCNVQVCTVDVNFHHT